jgi:hypothetical protein
MAIFGTVSAVAISFASTNMAGPVVSSASPSRSHSHADRTERVNGSAMAALAIKLDSGQFAQTANRLGLATEQALVGRGKRPSTGVRARLVHGAQLSARRRPEVAPVQQAGETPRSEAALVRLSRPNCASACSDFANQDADPTPVAPSAGLNAPTDHGRFQLAAGDVADTDHTTIAAELTEPSRAHGPNRNWSGAGLIVDEQQPALLLSAGELVADAANAADEPESSSIASADADTGQPESASVKPLKADIGIAESSGAAIPVLDGEHPSVVTEEAADGASSPQPARIASAQAVRGHLQRVKDRYGSADIRDRSTDSVQRTGLRQLGRSGDGVLVRTDLPKGATASPLIIHDDQLVAIKLGELVSLFEDRFDRPLYVWMRSSAAASKFVTAETLAAAGITAAYDPSTNRLVLSVEQ